ncbi:ribbon-helix-helix domain-containing protein [Gluconobacter kondonii]|uniref:ribbon-helix-helix domain-containing protein n=1 Tax=Gluconobacter kondonii TaxID=941463 RepID=UPI001B8B0A99|nr:ribbon-helix-helix domain-containing protein [Gluconobacter kondonii]MBS1058230.1 hypothetical protein [Gluconobacter kondonii]
MSKRPKLSSIGVDLGDLEAKPASGAKVPAFHEQPHALVADGTHVKDKAVNMTVYLMPDDHKRLKIMAVEHETTIQALVMDGLDILLERNGQQPLIRWKPRKKPRS